MDVDGQPHAESLDSAMTSYMHAALQPSTRKQYRTHMAMWDRFVTSAEGAEAVHGCMPGTLSDDVLALFVTFMARVGRLAPSSCLAYVQGVCTTFREAGTRVLPLRELYKTGRVLDGVGLTHHDRLRPPRQPLEVHHLLALYHEDDDLEGCSTHLLAVWSLIGLFRGSELVSGPSGRAITLERVLACNAAGGEQLAPIADLSIPAIAAADVLVVQLDASKTRQRGTERHPDFRPLYRAVDHRLCPIRALARYLRRRALTPAAGWTREGPLFVVREGGPASTRGMLAALRSRLQRAGYADVDVMGLHSGRIGGSTKGFAVGMQPDTVRRIGGWSEGSNVVFHYARPTLEALRATFPPSLQASLLSETTVTLLPTFATPPARSGVDGQGLGFPGSGAPPEDSGPSQPGGGYGPDS